MWYYLPLLCVICNGPVDLRQFQYQAEGSIRLKGWCASCRKDRYVPVDMETLKRWASHHEKTPSTKDTEFLHDLRIKWNPDDPKQG